VIKGNRTEHWLTLAFTLSVLGAFLFRTPVIRELLALSSFLFLAVIVSIPCKLSRLLFLAGLALHLIAFYWLPETLQNFGGFPFPIALAIHLLFAVTASLQFFLVGYLHKKFWRGTAPVGSFALLWGVTDLLYPQMFPWRLASPLVELVWISALAEICGVTVLSFLVLFFCELFVNWNLLDARKRGVAVGALAIAVLAAWGLDIRTNRSEAAAPKARIALIQGNIGLEEKLDNDQLSISLDTYRRLTDGALKDGAELIVWPETVMTEWTPRNVPNLSGLPYDPAPALAAPLLYGALTFERTGRKSGNSFNGAILRRADGQVSGDYAKRVLMPYGEYLPLEAYIPGLREFSPASGNFTSGNSSAPLEVPLSEGRVIKGVPLICYEDLVPWLSGEGTRRAGNVLVNITNDAWYGATAAPYQHQLLAQWRAVEFRKSFIRATNTGLTSVTSPSGRMVEELPIFVEGKIVREIPLLEGATIYALLGDEPFLMLMALSLLTLKFAIVFRERRG